MKRILPLLLLAVSATVGAATLDTTPFGKMIPFLVSGYAGSSTLEHFPVLVRLSENAIAGFDYDDVGTTASDARAALRFADWEGNNLNYEIDTWNADGESLVWVSIPAISGQTTRFSAYFKPDVSATLPAIDAAAVWTNADYIGVWHFGAVDSTDGSVADSAGNGDVPVLKRPPPGQFAQKCKKGTKAYGGRARLRSRRREEKREKKVVGGGARRPHRAVFRTPHSPVLSARRDGSPHHEIPFETVQAAFRGADGAAASPALRVFWRDGRTTGKPWNTQMDGLGGRLSGGGMVVGCSRDGSEIFQDVDMDLIHAMNELAAGIGMRPMEADETGGFTLLFDGVQEVSFAPDRNGSVFHATVGEAERLDREGLLSLLEASLLGAETDGAAFGVHRATGRWCCGCATGSFRAARLIVRRFGISEDEAMDRFTHSRRRKTSPTQKTTFADSSRFASWVNTLKNCREREMLM